MGTDSSSQTEPPHRTAKPKFEFPNSKQIQMSKNTRLFRTFEFGALNLFGISYFEIGNFIIHVA